MQTNPLKQFEQLLEDAKPELSLSRMRRPGEVDIAAIDIAERDGEFVVTCEMPGFDGEEIDIRLVDHTLHMHAEETASEQLEADDFIHRERRRTDISRTVGLPGDIAEDEVSASYEDGVLTVSLPKAQAEADDSHTIPLL